MKRKTLSTVQITLLIGFLIACNPGGKDTAPLKTDVEKTTLISNLEQTIPELMKKADVPGLSIAVIRAGKIIWTGAFGIKTPRPVNP